MVGVNAPGTVMSLDGVVCSLYHELIGHSV